MHAFNKLTKSKQKTIINAAIKEFAEKGYTGASTNSIIKNAGISKGALFFYFKKKETLYKYILEYAHNLNMEMVVNKCVDLSERDLFKRLSKYINGRLSYLNIFFVASTCIEYKKYNKNTCNIKTYCYTETN